jgi:hypothetical protein
MRLAIMSAAILAASSAAAETPEKISKTYPLTGFSQVVVAGVYDVEIEVGPQWSVQVSGDAATMARSRVSVSNGALVLATEKREKGEKRREKHSVTAIVTMPALEGVEITGVGDVDAKGIDASAFTVKLAGVGDIELAGRCEAITVELAGVGDVDAEGLECSKARARLGGVGDVAVFAREEAEAEVGGIGSVDIYGSPKKVAKQKSFLSDITVH